MKKTSLSVLMTSLLGVCALTGCQKAPQASADSDVYHAKSSLESEVENIAAVQAAVNTDAADGVVSGRKYDALVGTEENGIWICAKIPKVPQTVPALTLQKRDDLDAGKLEELLDSKNGNIKNITAEYLAQREKELSEMDEADKPGEWLNFGDDSLMVLSDGLKEVSFAGNTCASYVDVALKKNCNAIYKKAPEIDAIRDSKAALAKFSVSRAEKMLMQKLEVLDITEIYISEALYYELDGIAFYELVFTPSYGKVGVASEFGGIKFGEVHPRGTAWITKDGAVTLSLENYCGKITGQSENGGILTFPQVTGILEKYLENNTFCGDSKVKLTQAELVYYPALNGSELILTPSWHIYIPLKEMTELLDAGDKAWKKASGKGAVWNIYLDAVTGELIKVE